MLGVEVAISPESHETSDKVYKFMLGTFVALNVIDAVSTIVAFKIGAGAGFTVGEWGPGMAPLIGMIGVEAAMLVKATLISVGVVGGFEVGKTILSKYFNRNDIEDPVAQNLTSIGLVLLNGIFLATIISNIGQILKMI